MNTLSFSYKGYNPARFTVTSSPVQSTERKISEQCYVLTFSYISKVKINLKYLRNLLVLIILLNVPKLILIIESK